MLSGLTRVIAHVGYPTHSFKAPYIYNPWFEHHDLDARVVPMGVRGEDFAAFYPSLVRMTKVIGALVTMPHKVPIVDLVDEVAPAAQICGAANALLVREDGSTLADMFDGEGFTRGALRKGQQLAGRSALVVGSGGVGSAIAASLAAAGVSRLGLHDMDPARAEALAGRLVTHYPQLEVATGSNDPAGWEVVVNATPMGMAEGDPMPLDVDRIDPGTFVGEVVMTQRMTRFLTAAAERGCRVQVGTDMLFEQIPAYLEFFGFSPAATPDELRSLARIPGQDTQPGDPTS